MGKKSHKEKLEKCLSRIKALPSNTFMSENEINKKNVGSAVYMKATEFKTKFLQDEGILCISSRGRSKKKSIGSVLVPDNSENVYATKNSIAFTFDKTRYIINF